MEKCKVLQYLIIKRLVTIDSKIINGGMKFGHKISYKYLYLRLLGVTLILRKSKREHRAISKEATMKFFPGTGRVNITLK